MKAAIIVTLLAAVGTALPTSPQQDHKSLARRGRPPLFCETICGNLWGHFGIDYDNCVEGCTDIAAEPGAPVNLDEIDSGSGKA